MQALANDLRISAQRQALPQAQGAQDACTDALQKASRAHDEILFLRSELEGVEGFLHTAKLVRIESLEADIRLCHAAVADAVAAARAAERCDAEAAYEKIRVRQQKRREKLFAKERAEQMVREEEERARLEALRARLCEASDACWSA